MKIVVFFLSMTATLSAFAGCTEGSSNEEDLSSAKKIYITTTDLRIYNDTMYVFHANEWQRIFTLFSDENGLFVEKMPSTKTWYCWKCNTTHNCEWVCPNNVPTPSSCWK